MNKTLEEIRIESVEFTPYQLREGERNSDEAVVREFSRGDYTYIPKEYNGVANPSENLIMLLGGKANLKAENWAKTISHEVMHYILHAYGIVGRTVSERLVSMLEEGKINNFNK